MVSGRVMCFILDAGVGWWNGSTLTSAPSRALSHNHQAVQAEMSEMDTDRNESARDARLREALDSMKRLFPGVYGKVVELCKPVQRKYKVALTVAMGKSMNAIVVEDEATAMECIEYMRQQRAGVATFIPLDSIRVSAIDDRLRSVCRWAQCCRGSV